MMGFTDASLRTHLIGACLFLLSATAVQAQVTFTDASGSLESAYATWADDGYDSYNVYYSGTTTSRVRVYQDAEEADNTFSDPLQESILNAANTSGRVNLSEGNIIRVEYTDIIMTKGAAFVFD